MSRSSAPKPRRPHRLAACTLVVACGVVTADAARAARVLLDRTSVRLESGPAPSPLPLLVEDRAPRLPGGASALHAAWRLSRQADGPRGGRVEIDAGLSAALAGAFTGELPALLEERLRAASREAGHELGELTEAHARRIFVREADEAPRAELGSAALLRLLTRGDVRDRFSVREEVRSPAADPEDELAEPDGETELPTPDVAEPPSAGEPATEGRLPETVLHVSVAAAGLHLDHSDYRLPGNLAHLSVRVRAWDVPSGTRRWDRSVVVGEELGGRLEFQTLAEAYRDASERCVAHAAGLIVAGLWPDDASPPIEDEPEAPPPPPDPLRDVGADELLALLAERRLAGGTTERPWSDLHRAVRGTVGPAERLLLALAEDAAATAADAAAGVLGTGVAEAHRRLESSPPLRRSVAEDLVRQVARARGSDRQLERAARALVGELAGQPSGDDAAREAAQPLLDRARRGRAGTPESIACLLISVRIAPSESAALLRELLAREQRPGPG